MTPFDFVKDIEYTKHDLMKDDPLAEKDYIPFVVNRALSYQFDCVLFANEMNQRYLIDKKLQYHYLLHVIRSRRRTAQKWVKPEKIEDITVIQRAYGFTKREALQALPLLKEHELELLRDKTDLGGIKKSK